MEENNIDNSAEKNNNTFIIIAVVTVALVTVVGIIGFLQLPKYEKNNNPSEPNNPIEEIEKPIETNDTVIIKERKEVKDIETYNYTVGYSKETKEEYYYRIYLRDDGTFRFSFNYESDFYGLPVKHDFERVGTYEKKDNKLYLTGTIEYDNGIDTYCYYEQNSNITLKINNDGSLLFTSSEGEYNLKRNDSIKESLEDIYYFEIDPQTTEVEGYPNRYNCTPLPD